MLSKMALKTTQACEPKAVNSSLFPKYQLLIIAFLIKDIKVFYSYISRAL